MKIFTQIKSFKKVISQMRGYATVNEKITYKTEFKIILLDLHKRL